MFVRSRKKNVFKGTLTDGDIRRSIVKNKIFIQILKAYIIRKVFLSLITRKLIIRQKTF